MTAFPVKFLTIRIWLQVWGLKFDLINEEAVRDIGQGIGRVIEVVCKAIASDQARFHRVRVDMPLDNLYAGEPQYSVRRVIRCGCLSSMKAYEAYVSTVAALGMTQKLHKYNIEGGGGKSIR